MVKNLLHTRCNGKGLPAQALLLAVALLMLVTASCSRQKGDTGTPIAEVNNYVISAHHFRQELSANAYFNGLPAISQQDKQDFLNQLIKQELLIQAALNAGLDKRDAFRRAIQNYWEQTLIAAIIKKKSAQLARGIIVTQEEVQQRYQELAQQDPKLPPLKAMAPQIEQQLRNEKKTAALADWIDGLRRKAHIHIYEKNLKALH